MKKLRRVIGIDPQFEFAFKLMLVESRTDSWASPAA